MYTLLYYLVYGQILYFNIYSHQTLLSTTLTLKKSQFCFQLKPLKKKREITNKVKTCLMRKVGDGGVYFFFKWSTSSKLLYHFHIQYRSDPTSIQSKLKVNPWFISRIYSGFTFQKYGPTRFLFRVYFAFTRKLLLGSTVRNGVWIKPVFYLHILHVLAVIPSPCIFRIHIKRLFLGVNFWSEFTLFVHSGFLNNNFKIMKLQF